MQLKTKLISYRDLRCSNYNRCRNNKMQSFTRASRTLARMAWCEQRLTAAAVRPLHVSASAAAEAMPLPSVEKVVERVGLLNRRF